MHRYTLFIVVYHNDTYYVICCIVLHTMYHFTTQIRWRSTTKNCGDADSAKPDRIPQFFPTGGLTPI